MAKMLSKQNIETHIGSEVKLRKRLWDLEQVEEYFISKCKKAKIEYSHDCTADENTYFKTLNYTTYAGLFIMHPLSFAHMMFQMYDAKADNLSSAGHIEWVAENLKHKKAGKYTDGSGQELCARNYADFTHIAVLAGSNKFFEHTSKKKYDIICKRHGSKLLLKPHPITNTKVMGEIFDSKGDAQMATRKDNLYELMEKADTVYTTHISETALTALLMGKKISPLDPWGRRLMGSFSHINHFCFSEEDPVNTLKSIFASPKSGVIHPSIDKDWKGKVDQYFDYILSKRQMQKGYYFE